MYAANPLEVPLEWRTKLLPQIIDYRAKVTPNLLYAEYPISPTSYDQGFRKSTYKDLANAINGVAWWLQSSLGPPTTFNTLAYIGPNDIRTPALILGAVKAGYVIFLTSPRNSIPAQFHLFAQAKCTTLISSNPPSPAITAILKTPNHGLQTLEVPSVEKLVGEVHPHFPYEKAYDDVHMESIGMIHTSGSTGMPKPLSMTHSWVLGNIEMMAKDAPPGFDSLCGLWRGSRVFAVFPPFHVSYYFFMVIAIFVGSSFEDI